MNLAVTTWKNKYIVILGSWLHSQDYIYYIGPCYYGMMCSQAMGGGDNLQIQGVVANVLNKQLQIADNELNL
jgi:hypothetical protein